MNYLIVYGTLRAGSGHPMHQTLAQQADYAGPGWLRGRLYRIDGYPAYVPTTIPGEWVRGDLYVLRATAWLWAELDAYEEVKDEVNSEYLRRKCLIRLDEQRWCVAWAYVYNWPVDPALRIESGDFLAQ